jgi:hypothetical protein
MIWGPSGAGKTEMLEDLIASIPDCLQITLSLGSREALDFAGIPSIVNNRTVCNDPEMVPLQTDLLPYIPDTIGTPDERRYSCVVVYIDELPEGDTPTLKAIYRMLNERKVNNSDIHHAVRFVASGNPPEAGAFTEALLPTVANRMMHINVRICHKEWISWATGKGISPVQRAFIAQHGLGMLSNYNSASKDDAFATPRTHARLHAYMAGDAFTDQTLIAQGAPVQYLGEEVGLALLAFADATDMPNIEEVLRDPKNISLDMTPGSMFLLGQALVSFATVDNIEAVLQVMGRMPANHKAVNFMSLMGLPRRQYLDLMTQGPFSTFVVENQNLLHIIQKVRK